MEVCVDSVQSALNAANGGAIRLELCCGLGVGGLTPSMGLLKTVKKLVSIPVYVLIRPRSGDFLYSPYDVEVMLEDIITLKKGGADGFVFGSLKHDGTVDEELCAKLMNECRPLPATFHRAIDMTKDPVSSLEPIIKLGFSCVLSSGGGTTTFEGISTLKRMIKTAAGRITVMPGGGISEKNIEEILRETRASIFHASAKHDIPSKMTYQHGGVSMATGSSCDEFSLTVTNEDAIRNMTSIAKKVWADTNI